MKRVLLVLYVIIPLSCYAQPGSNERFSGIPALEQLKNKAESLKHIINEKSDSLALIQSLIEKANHKSIISKYTKEGDVTPLLASIRRPGIIRKNTETMEIADSVKKSDTIRILDYKYPFWIVVKGDVVGYLDESYINSNLETQTFKSAISKRNYSAMVNAELEEIAGKRKMKEQEAKSEAIAKAEREREVIGRYGQIVGKKLLNGYYWIGMSAEMATISLGRPRTVNKDVGVWGAHEQWVYHDLNLYFEKGVVVSYQNSQ